MFLISHRNREYIHLHDNSSHPTPFNLHHLDTQERYGVRFNQKPYFRMLCNLVLEVSATDETVSFQVSPQLLVCVYDGMRYDICINFCPHLISAFCISF